MKDLIIAIRVGSPNSRPDLVFNTLSTIRTNIGTKDYLVLLSIGLNIPSESRNVCTQFARLDARFSIFQVGEVYWAEFINLAINEATVIGCKYFIKAHDDIELETSDFYSKLESCMDRIGDRVGWISFTDTGWKRGDFSPAVREGYHVDSRDIATWRSGRVFQFHRFPKFWFKSSPVIHYPLTLTSEILRYFRYGPLPYPKPVSVIKNFDVDTPRNPVRVHAPYNHFVAIKLDVLRKIGLCENWGTWNALYVDEDWGLQAGKLGFTNIWIPEIEYFHYRGEGCGGSTRSLYQIKSNGGRVAQEFLKKWGFHPAPTDKELESLNKHYKGSMITWSIGRLTYDWDYVL